MQIGIIGAGAVGGVFAALLDRAGHDVEITARGPHLDAIRSSGLTLTGSWGEHTTALLANPQLSRPAALVIVTTKAHDAAAAIAANAQQIGDAPMLVIQNGLSGVHTAEIAAPDSAVVGGLALFAASYVSPGRVTVTAGATTYLGGERAGEQSATALAVRALSAALPVRVLEGRSAFESAQWTKLIINQINALPAITGLSAQEVIQDRALRTLMTAGMREAVRIGLATGVHYGSLQGLNHSLLALFARLPLTFGQRLPLEIGKRMGSTPNPGSTLQSVRRGQRTEIDFLNGAIVEAAHRLGRTAPINAALVHLVHEVETTGAFVRPAEILERIEGTR